MGFSPCHSRIRNKYEFFSKLLSRYRLRACSQALAYFQLTYTE